METLVGIPIERLPNPFKDEGYMHTIIKRDERVALVGMHNHYNDKIFTYLVCQIHLKVVGDVFKEYIASTELFGLEMSRHIHNYDDALAYYEECIEFFEKDTKSKKYQDRLERCRLQALKNEPSYFDKYKSKA